MNNPAYNQTNPEGIDEAPPKYNSEQYDASKFNSKVFDAPTYRLAEEDFQEHVNDLVDLGSVQIRRRHPMDPMVCHPLCCLCLMHNPSEEPDKLEIRTDQGKMLFKVEMIRSIKLVLCVGNFKLDVGLKSINSKETHDGDTVKKGKSIVKLYNKANVLNSRSKQSVKLKNSKGETIGNLTKVPFDPKTVGRGDKRRTSWNVKYIITNSDKKEIYCMKGEGRFHEMKTWATPSKTFYIYDVDNYGEYYKTGKFVIKTSPTGGICGKMEADCDDPHILYFPDDATWECKILLLMMSLLVELEFTDRTTCIPGC